MKTCILCILLLRCALADEPNHEQISAKEAVDAVVRLAEAMVQVDQDYLPLLNRALEARTVEVLDGRIESGMWTINVKARTFNYVISWPNVTFFVSGEFTFNHASKKWETKITKQQAGRPSPPR